MNIKVEGLITLNNEDIFNEMYTIKLPEDYINSSDSLILVESENKLMNALRKVGMDEEEARSLATDYVCYVAYNFQNISPVYGELQSFELSNKEIRLYKDPKGTKLSYMIILTQED